MISDRQKSILAAIIEEFMTNAEEVGSTYLLNKYDLGVSSATIRNEMVRLMEEGLLEKSHASSGRMPTDLALKLYINENSKLYNMSPMDEIEIKQGIFRVRFSYEQLVKQLLDILVEKCNTAAFYISDDDRRFYGVSSLMKYEELRNIHVLERVLDILEDSNMLRNIFSKHQGEETSVIIGSESGITDFENCALAFTKVKLLKGREGHMGVIGSKRLNYSMVVPMLNTLRNSVEQSLQGWM
ncbi:MAG TPA: hypothetical protein VHA74_02715 [Candidatus Dojkabacteria bacterium]|nr:hypothetical protein [Candidatus Dojkabacteria bacterium]